MDWRDYTSLYKPSSRKSGRDYFDSTEKKADEVDSDDWRDYVTLAAKPQKTTSKGAQRNKTDNSALVPAKASELYYTGSRAETPEGLKKRISVLEAEKKNLEDIGSGYVYFNQKNPNSNEIKNIEREISELENKKWKNKKAADLSLNTLAHSPDYSQLSKAPDFGNSLSADSRFRAVNNKGWQKFLDESEGVRASGANYKYMTAEEVSNFNYLYNKFGKEKAGEYLDYLEDELDSRYQTDYQWQMSEYSREHPIAATIGSTVNNIMGGPIGTIDLIGQGISNKIREGTGQDKKPINFNSYATTGARTANTIRGTIASDLNEKGTINIPILGAKGLGDLYQLGTSMLDSYAVGLAAGGAGSFVLGSSAAVNGMIEAKERGLSDEEAVGLGTLNGIAETAFEYLSLDKLIEIKDAKTIKDFVKNVAKQGLLFEGTEEAATTIANTISDVIITGDKNKLRESVNEYMSMGLSEKEAYKKAVSQWFSDLLWDYIGGALTGGFMGGAQTAIQNTMRNSEYNYTGKEIMASEDSMSGLRESLEKYTDLEQLSENPTAKEVGRAYYGVMEKYDSEARQAEDEALNDIAQAAKNRVMELSAEDENSTDIAAAVEKSIKEEKLSKNEAALLKKSETARAVMDELGKGEAEWVQPFIYNDDTDGKVITKTEDIKSVSIDKNGSAVVRLADGSEKSYMDVDFADLEVPGIIEAAAQYGKDADKMFQSYMSENSVTKKQNPETFIRQFNNAFEYGKLGASLEYTKKSGVASNLTDTQLEKALLMGQIAKNRETAAKQKAIDEKRAAGIKIKGQLNMDKLSDKTRKNLNADQRASVAFFEKLADYGGLNIIMEESTANAEGEYIMPNGFIDTDGTIHIDINAGAASIQSDRTFLMYTMSHELTHLIEEAAPEKYKELSDFAVRVLTDEKGLSLEALIQAKKDGFERGQINRMRKDYPNLSEKSLRERITPMSDEAALKEVVADAMQEVLPNSNLIERLASENKTLFEKVKDAILKIINDIKALYKEVKASGAEAAALKSRLDEITELWTAAAQEAIGANNERSSENVRGEEVYHSRGWLGNEEDNTGGQIGEGGSAVQGEEKTVKEGRRYTGRNSQIYASDSEGRGISQNISERLKGTSIVDENGRPIAVYHSTPDMDFMEFAKGDTGFHFGSETQAKERASKKGDKGRTIKAYLNIKNPLPVDLDAMNWRANSAAIHLWNDGIITEEQYLSIKKLSIESGTDYNSPAAVELRRILSEKGYDGITYENEYEGEGKSYIAFYPEQVVIFDDGKGKQYQERNSERFTYDELVKKPDINVVKAVEYTDDIDRKTIINNGYQSAINAGRIDESGMPSIYVEDIGREVHVSRAAIQHGLDRRLKVQAPLVQNIGEVIKNSIAINEAAPKKKTADSSYLLLGAAKLSDNDIYFASIVVNKFTNEVKSIDVMYSANVKKVESAALDGARASGQKPLSLTDSKISVADALDLVKDYFANVLPMDVLNHYGIERTESEFAHRLKYQERQDVTADRRGFVKLLEKGDLSESERRTLNKYSGYIDTLDKYDRDLNKLQGEINEIFFGKGQEIYTVSNGAFLSREEYLNELIKRRDSLRDEVAKWDGKIVRFEVMDVMKSLILKEKSMSISKYRMERNKTQVRQRIRAIVKNFNSMLAQPDKKRYIPVKLVNTVISLCESINFENPRLNSENIKARLEKAKAVYEGYKNDSTYQHVYDEDLSERISEVIKIIGDTPLVDMSEGQLTSLYNLLKQLQHTVTNARQTFAYDSQKDIFEIGDRLMNETANAAYLVKGEKVNELLNMQLTPEKFFNRLGGYVKNSAWSKVADMFTKGTENSLFVQRDFQYFFKDFTENEEIESFTDTKNLVDAGLKDSGGKSINLTRGMMLSLYMHLKNKQNVIALMYGGTTVPGIKKYYNGKIADAYARGSVRAAPLVEGIRDLFDKRMELLNELEALSEFENDKGANEYTDYYSTGEFNMVRAGEIQSELSVLERQIDAAEKQGFETAKRMQKNIEGMLTPFEKKFIERAKEWYDVKSRDYINGVTLKMYGIKKAGIVDYYTIHRDTNFINTEFVSVVNDMSIENWGALNVRVKSTAPVLLTDIIFELDNHVKKLSAYVGFAAATRDFKLLYNVKGKGHLTSVKEAVLKKFGAGKRKAGVSGEAYIENFMSDLSGKVQSQPSAFAAVRRNLARSALSINLRVAASQIAATFSAMGEAGWKATLKGMGRGIKRSFEKGFLNELEQKNVWFWSRRRGMGGMREFSEMKDGGNIFDKAYNWVDEKTAGRLLNWCQAVDVRSTAIMYSIAEVYVENELKLKKGMEGYDSQVNQTFSDLLRKTQPNNLTTEMSDIFRDKRETYKALTMFKSQNNQFFNMWFDSTARYRQYRNDFKKGLNGVTEADVKKAGDTLAATTFTVAVINPLAYGVLRFAANAVLRCLTNYRDDDDEITVGAILNGILDDTFNSLFGVFLMGDELYEIFTSIVFDKPYYGLTEPGISAVGDLIGCVMDLGGEVKKAVSGEENDLTSFELYNKLLKRFSIVAGIPYANTKMIYDAVNGYIHDTKDGGMFSYEYGVERSATTQGSRMYKAILLGDADKYEAVYDELYGSYIEKGKSESDAASQTRTALKGVIREEYQDGKISEEKAREILEQYFDMDEDDIYWQFDEWKYKAENKGDYSRYSELNDAVISGDKAKIKEQYKYFDKHGVDKETVDRQITAYIGKLYKNGEMSKETAKNRLVKLRGMSYSEARKKIKEWDESEEEAS